jgi:copper(I)-binding protein
MIRFILAIGLLAVSFAGHAHGSRVGDLRIDHPYATPSRPGVQTGAVYFRSLDNRGRTADRLLSATTPAADRVEIHQMHMDGDIMRMRAVPDLDLPARTVVRMRHHTPNGHHLMLRDLKVPLKDGDRFPLTLHFEKAGSATVQVWVQTPRDADPPHKH